MNIALAQTHIEWEDKEKNYETAGRYITEAKESGSDIVFFPEMSFTGFSMNVSLTGEEDGQTIDYIRKLAKDNELAVGFGYVKRGAEKHENHYVVVDKNGNVITDYIKIHPFSYSGEDSFFEGGNQLTRFSFMNEWFSVFICYDLRFPEIFRALPWGISAVVIPANWPESRREHWITLLKARAIENQIYIFAVNCCGTIGNIKYSGDSCVIDPEGHIECILTGSEGLLRYTFTNDIVGFRNRFPNFADRKKDLYIELLLDKRDEI